VWASIALVLVAAAGCWDDTGPYATTGSGGHGASGKGGTGGGCDACDAGGGTGGTGDGTGTGTGGGGSGEGGGGTGGTSVGGASGTGGPPVMQPWPSDAAVVAVDNADQFPKNLSDLVYQPATAGVGDVLWAVKNDPSTLYCLLWDGTTWNGMTDDGWSNGKALHYPGGAGAPDAEGLTRVDWSSTAIYVAAERDNSVPNVSRMSVLLYDYAGASPDLTALQEWDLTPDFPVSPANQGIESVAWIPDSFLVANKFQDETTNRAYDPKLYPDHGGGLFLVGHETTGAIHGYVLDHTGGGIIQRVATIASGHPALMSLDFDRDQGNLWAYCDDTCSNQASVLRIDASGRFQVFRLYDHPASLPNSNDEGITIAPESECVNGFKSFFWSDDNDLGHHAIYRGSIPCGPLP
jgi:hypothetical protein